MSPYVTTSNLFILAALAGFLCGMLDGFIRSRSALAQLKDDEEINANLGKVVSEFATIRSTMLAVVAYVAVFSLPFDLTLSIITASVGAVVSLFWGRRAVNNAIREGGTTPEVGGWTFAIAYMLELFATHRTKPSIYAIALAHAIARVSIALAVAFTVGLLASIAKVGLVNAIIAIVGLPISFAVCFAVGLIIAFLFPDSGKRNI
ncbi:MAG: hypothetical protein K2Y39_25370 [Candidatus Obscuribacterales bacterium]|nr:hypothetical protein [Candidatus Obscuribacterales bacterium]